MTIIIKEIFVKFIITKNQDKSFDQSQFEKIQNSSSKSLSFNSDLKKRKEER